MKRVAVALSGGVDSAVAAALLMEHYEVMGVTMLLRDPSEPSEEDPAEDSAVLSAARVASYLGIDHHVMDVRGVFAEKVIDPFVRAYRSGETPNPCIRCNALVKFGVFLQAVLDLGADIFATGHYARMAFQEESGRYYLRRGIDRAKDQSYMLYGLSQKQLCRMELPLGGLTKDEVRAEACRRGVWETVEQKESQDICFLDDRRGDYAELVAARAGTSLPGVFVDKQGCFLGEHHGIEHFTVGQRRGLGVALGHRAYVIGIDPARREVILGNKNDVFLQELWADRLNWNFWENCECPSGFSVQAQTRYHAPAAEAHLFPEADFVRVVFDTPQKAAAPGQAVVFYQGDRLLGGGRIISDFRGIRRDLLQQEASFSSSVSFE